MSRDTSVHSPVHHHHVSPFDSINASSTIDRRSSNCSNATEKVQKSGKLIETGEYDAAIAKYIPGALELVLQGML